MTDLPLILSLPPNWLQEEIPQDIWVMGLWLALMALWLVGVGVVVFTLPWQDPPRDPPCWIEVLLSRPVESCEPGNHRGYRQGKRIPGRSDRPRTSIRPAPLLVQKRPSVTDRSIFHESIPEKLP